jgi:inosine/xanthosine triphosphate pyrophosphatase family protein
MELLILWQTGSMEDYDL